ncbi:M3 family metallopeptidase [Basilea psittacipulmonis]|uniref:oligopeptidase A n=1 Tax=Basilea psittacipulmonis DSM 24701 TaxID=1072685 RepID=A0A077DHC0_9BURK|nr:M3 family metallopeptidase [Basilea psittacipulmonis]AIL32543.1 oligopeptidase A [Basilea psittacipulmonis DSM 24701]
MNNPLFAPLESLIDYASVTPAHIKEAIPVLLEKEKSTILETIRQCQEKADFDLLCHNPESMYLSRAWTVATHLNAVVDTAEIREVINELLPQVSAFSTWVGLNKELFNCYVTLSKESLTHEQQRVVDLALKNFRLAGVELEGQAREAFAKNNEELALTQQKFSENCLDATDEWAYFCHDEAELSGLPQSVIDMARQEAGDEAGWKFTLKAPSLIPVLKYADNQALRRAVHRGYSTLASDQGNPKFNNAENIEKELKLRHEQAEILGFHDFAALKLETRMAENTESVVQFLRELAKKAKPFAQKDVNELKSFAKEHLNITELEPCDYAYVSEKLRQQRYHYSDEEVRQYLPQTQVLDGLKKLIKRLYNVDMVPVSDAKVWHPSVELFCLEENGQKLGYLYMDLYARKGKQSGAWVNGERPRLVFKDQLILPVATLTCNFPSAQGDRPSLLTHDDVITLFHEMGHALHCILSQVPYDQISAFSAVEWDAIELPSQFMENFCWEKDILISMTSHWQTGEPLPQALYEKMIAAKNFQSGMQTVRQIEFALFDILLHQETQSLTIHEVMALLHQVRQEVSVVQAPEWNRFPHSFSHLFAGGYAAGYYSYKWAEVLSADVYAAFEENPDYAQMGQKFRQEILSVGGLRPAATSFRAFRGRDPKIDALLRHGGLSESA